MKQHNMRVKSFYSILLLCAAFAAAGCSKKPAETKPEAADAPQPSAEAAAENTEAGVNYAPAPVITKTDACPEGAFKTKDGVCSCFYGMSKTEQDGRHAYGDLKPDGSDVLGASFKCADIACDSSGFMLPETICPNIRGCMAADGRWYPGLANATIKTQDYYVPGGMDTTLETVSEYGDCVLDRTDGIPLYSAKPDAKDSFACDRQSCACGTQTCHNGDICKDGKCTKDKQEPIELNDSNSIFEYHYSDYTIAGAGCWGKVVDTYHELYNQCEQTGDAYCTLNVPEEEKVDGADFGLRTIDAKTCKGGKRYCHGRGNFPMPAPKAANGYECQTIYDIPGFQSKDQLKAWTCAEEDGCKCGDKVCPKNAACIDEACLCGSETIPENYSCSEYCIDEKCTQKKHGIRCDTPSCACGQNTCQNGDFCRDGQCFCDHIPAPGNGYTCNAYTETSTYLVHNLYIADRHTERHYPKCTKEEECQCGENSCMKDMYCISGNCYCGETPVTTHAKGLQCDHNTLKCDAASCNCYGHKIKKDDFCYRARCGFYGKLDEKGCKCGGVPMDDTLFSCELGKDGKPIAICTDSVGCSCDKAFCPINTACVKGQCVDYLTLKPKPGKDVLDETVLFDKSNGLPVCNSDAGCACGKKSCEKGKYCINGVCFRDPFTKKFDNKVLYYRFTNTDSPEDNTINYRPTNLLFEDENKKLCEYEKELRSYYDEYGGIFFKKYKDDSFDNHLCANEQYKDMTIGEFLKNCGTGPVPADVAVKYCYIGLEFVNGEVETELSINYSGWEGEDFKFDFPSVE